MRILIVRSGSGWGGIVCRYMIDTSEKIIVDLFGCYKLKKILCILMKKKF